jgi:tRNA (cytidine/uridine-2'-O-)-methyltransferase
VLNIVLFQPEIPPNTGNISRQCVGMNARLHIIGPIAFDLSDTAVRRAGLDHWDELNLSVHDNPDEFLGWLGERIPWLVTKHGRLRYDKPDFRREDIIILGNETKGLPEQWLERWSDTSLYIPILGKVRSYNLANTAGIVLAQACLKAGIYDKQQGPA